MNMRDAQLQYDNQTPEDTPDPLDIIEVSNWIESAADDLMCGRDVMLDGRIVVDSYKLSDLVAAEAVKRYNEGIDEDGNLGQLILSALDYNAGTASACARSLFGFDKNWCRDSAIELIEPFALEILEQIKEENRDDS
jgi:hypothetical protein